MLINIAFFHSDGYNPIHIDTISMDLFILYFKGSLVDISKFLYIHVFLSLHIAFILAYSADPDEMLQYAEFHQGLHCLPNYAIKSH